MYVLVSPDILTTKCQWYRTNISANVRQSKSFFPSSSKLLSSSRHGSQTCPYFFSSPASSSRCSFYSQNEHASLIGLARLTIFHGTSAYTSVNNSFRSGFLSVSARLNALSTSCFRQDLSSSSSVSFHHPRDSMNKRKRVIGLSIFFLFSTSWRPLYANESSDVE